MKPKTRLTALTPVSVLLTSALLVSGCGGATESSAESSTFRILLVAAQTGPLAALGEPFLTGLQVAADELNAKGGVLGREVRIKVLDPQSDPTKAVSLLQQELAGGDKPDLVYDGTVSAETLAMLPVLSSRKILSIGTTANAAINDPEKYPYAFHAAPHQDTDATPSTVRALRELGCRDVGLLVAGDASGEPVRKAYPPAFKSAGIPLKVEEYAPADIDMAAPLQRLKSAGVDCVTAYAAGPTAPYVLKSRAKIGWTVPLLLNESMTADIHGLVPAGALKGVSIHTFGINAYRAPADRTPAYKALLDGVKAKGGFSTIMINYAWPHDMLQLVAMGAEQARSTDADAVKKALENLRQPAPEQRPYSSYTTMGWSATDHFIKAGADDFAVIDPVPALVDGTWK